MTSLLTTTESISTTSWPEAAVYISIVAFFAFVVWIATRG